MIHSSTQKNPRNLSKSITRYDKYWYIKFYLWHIFYWNVPFFFVVALPPEVYTIWEAYPWRFGEPFCIFKAFLLEWTSYASVLTITGFTVERYIAICHPITGQKVTRQSRAFKCIICIWIISACCALPYPFHTRTFYYLNDPRTNLPITDTLLCNIPVEWHKRMIVMFQVSTFAFFFLPMTVITIMYILIGIRLRRTEVDTSMGIQYKGALSTTARARKAVLKMLGTNFMKDINL